MTIANTTRFAAHYLAATELMLDAVSDPSASRWADAREHAALAKSRAFGSTEEWLAAGLLSTVMDGARLSGYTGYRD